MKKVTNADLIRKIDYSESKKPAFIETFKTIQDSGFRSYMADIILKDERRRKSFVESQKKD